MSVYVVQIGRSYLSMRLGVGQWVMDTDPEGAKLYDRKQQALEDAKFIGGQVVERL